VKTKTVIIITGPTASGKTSLAITAAQYFDTEIISADSRQCYREMNIGVAKPSPQQLNAVAHHFINSHSIHDEVNAATFAAYAHSVAEKVFARRDVIIMCGGTGLYIKAFTDGLDDIPRIDTGIRERIVSGYQKNGFQWLQEEVRMKDPKYYVEGEIQNPQRLMRALEVVEGTGKSIRDFHTGTSAAKKYDVVKYAISIPRDQLYNNINSRVDRMMEEGLLNEVQALLPFRNLNALQTVGYTEIFEYLDGAIRLPDAVAKIKQNTRNYAKRQMTWFRKDKELKWINSDFSFTRGL
jgi:tRNA dimethylallyltransferase